jgi:dTDP-4-amino-4,6-dideoxygalactose transaminase
MDPNLIEAAITDKTTAILATHVYGIPCAVEQIEAIAKQYRLKVIYDAAHTFGGKYRSKSIVSYGDISTLSFHATKIFHTAEGGALITDDDTLAHRISYLRNFGHKGQEDFWGLGINGKNSEFHAAMGLCVLPYITEIIAKRKQVSAWYDELLKDSDVDIPERPEGTEYNYAYYPVLFPSKERLEHVKSRLNERQIFPRRYFYPSLNDLPYVTAQQTENSVDISNRVMCLPLYVDLSKDEIVDIALLLRG